MTVIIAPAKLAVANRYLNLLRNSKKRAYGWAYLEWLKEGCVGNEPERNGLGMMAAQAVRMQIDAMNLWEGTL